MRYILILLLLSTLPLLGSININTASQSKLTSLPGIGKGRAKAIVEYRELEGPFASIEDIKKVPGFSEKLFNKVRDDITTSNSGSRNSAKKQNRRSRSVDADRILNRFKNEPTIAQVQKAALKYAHMNNDTYSSWITRAKNQAWLPKAYVKARKTDQSRDGYDQDELGLGSFDDLTTTTTDTLYFEAKVEFDLKKLIFTPDELKVNNTILKSIAARKKLLESITKLYFNRRKNQVNLILKRPRNANKLLQSKMKIAEQTAMLDALTNGFFSKNIR